MIYLDTAEYILVGDGAEDAAAELKGSLKRNVKTGRYRGGDVGEEAKYLDVHGTAENQ